MPEKMHGIGGKEMDGEAKHRRSLLRTVVLLFVLTYGLAQDSIGAAGQAPQESLSPDEVFAEVEKALENEKALSPETRESLKKLVTLLRSENVGSTNSKAPHGERTREDWGPKQEVQANTSSVIASDLAKKLKVSGLSYLRYSYNLEDSKSPGSLRSVDDGNEFNIDRVYLTLDWQLWDKGKVSYTLEGGEIRDGNGHYDVTTKAFFLEVRDLLYPSTYLWIGQADLPWVAYEEGLWGYRFQGTVFPDRMGYMTSTDLGVGFGGDIPGGYGDYQLSVVNGEGWTHNEVGKHKDLHARLTLRPFGARENALKNLFVTGFASVGAYDDVPSGPDDRNRWIAQIGYKNPGRLTLVGEYFQAKDPAVKMALRYPTLDARSGRESDAQGFSIFGTLNAGVLKDSDFARKWEFLARWDHLDPDGSISGNNVDLWLAGVSYRWNKNIRLLLNYEEIDHEDDFFLMDSSRIMLQAELVM
jgi:hypothetical protein